MSIFCCKYGAFAVPEDPNPRPARFRWVELATIGTEAVLAPTVGVVIGLYVDQKYGWFPWCTLTGFVVGGLAAAQVILSIKRRLDLDDE